MRNRDPRGACSGGDGVGSVQPRSGHATSTLDSSLRASPSRGFPLPSPEGPPRTPRARSGRATLPDPARASLSATRGASRPAIAPKTGKTRRARRRRAQGRRSGVGRELNRGGEVSSAAGGAGPVGHGGQDRTTRRQRHRRMLRRPSRSVGRNVPLLSAPGHLASHCWQTPRLSPACQFRAFAVQRKNISPRNPGSAVRVLPGVPTRRVGAWSSSNADSPPRTEPPVCPLGRKGALACGHLRPRNGQCAVCDQSPNRPQVPELTACPAHSALVTGAS